MLNVEYTPDPNPTLEEATQDVLRYRKSSGVELGRRIAVCYGLCNEKGTFDQWIEEYGPQIGLKRRAIFNHMSVYKTFKDEPQDVTDKMDFSAMLILAGAPESILKEGIEKAKSGFVTKQMAKDLVAPKKSKPVAVTVAAGEKVEPAQEHEEADKEMDADERERLEDIRAKRQPVRVDEVDDDTEEDEETEEVDELDDDLPDDLDLDPESESSTEDEEWDIKPGRLTADKTAGFTIPDMIRYIADNADALIRQYEAEQQPIGVRLDLKAMVSSLGM